MWTAFSGSVLPAYGGETQEKIPTFGKGSNEVRLYADYFCLPCGSIEPAIEDSLIRLVRDGTYRVTFVDVPFHKGSFLYATHFLYACNAGVDIVAALRVRHVLFQQAREGVADERTLTNILSSQNVQTKPYDVSPTLKALNRLIREDSVNNTPSCVIITAGGKKKYAGSDDVKNAIIKLSQP